MGANPKPSLLNELLDVLETKTLLLSPASYWLYPIMVFLQFWSELNQYV